MRAVTHYDVARSDCEEAIEALSSTLARSLMNQV
jgi:hypothetical protein